MLHSHRERAAIAIEQSAYHDAGPGEGGVGGS